MVRSSRPNLASDAMIREVARQLANTAPPAPSWWDITATGASEPAESHRGGPRLLAIAVVTILLATGVWWLSGTNEQSPADVPVLPPVTTVTATPEDSATAWRTWVGATDPLIVQICLTQSRSNLAATGDLPIPATNAMLPGYSADVQQIVWQRPMQPSVRAIAEHPDASSGTRSGLLAVSAAYDAAEAQQFNDDGSISDDLEEFVDDFLIVRETSDVMSPNSSTCWLDATTDPNFSPSMTADPVLMLQCLALTQLDHALSVSAEGVPTWDSIVEAAALGAVLQIGSPPPAFADLNAEISEQILFETWDASDAAAARTEIAQADLGLPVSECPLMPIGDTAATPVATTKPGFGQ